MINGKSEQEEHSIDSAHDLLHILSENGSERMKLRREKRQSSFPHLLLAVEQGRQRFFVRSDLRENPSQFSAGTDLPDDDYTTLVPHSKPINGTSQKSSQIPIIIEGINDSKPKRGIAENRASWCCR